MPVDVDTLYYLIVGTTLIGACLTLWECRFNVLHRREMGLWASGYCLVGGGCLLRMFHESLPGFVSIGLSNLAVLAGYASVAAGTVGFARGRLPRALPIAAGLAAFAWLGWGQYASIEIRIVATALLTAASCLYVSAVLRPSAAGMPPLVSQRLVRALFTFHGLFFLARAGVTLAGLEGRILFTGANFAATMIEGILWSAFAPAALLMMVRETTERRLIAASETDFLTGIGNRRAFMARAARMIEERALPVSVTVFDLDHFKTINDRHGHALGDDVLRQFCRVVAKELSPDDAFGRLGGEEFAVAFRDCGAEDAQRRASAMSRLYTEEIARRFPLSFRATVSAGVAERGPGDSLESLLSEADAALYRAKREGRDRTLIAQRSVPPARDLGAKAA